MAAAAPACVLSHAPEETTESEEAPYPEESVADRRQRYQDSILTSSLPPVPAMVSEGTPLAPHISDFVALTAGMLGASPLRDMFLRVGLNDPTLGPKLDLDCNSELMQTKEKHKKQT